MKNSRTIPISRRKLLAVGSTATILTLAGCTDTDENNNTGDNDTSENTLQGDNAFTATPIHVHPDEIQVTPTDFDGELLYDQEPIEIPPSDSRDSVDGEFLASDVVLVTPEFTEVVISTLYTCENEEIASELRAVIDESIQEIYDVDVSEELSIGTNGVVYGTDDTGEGEGLAKGVLRVENIVCHQGYVEIGAPTRTLTRRLEDQLENTVERINSL